MRRPPLQRSNMPTCGACWRRRPREIPPHPQPQDDARGALRYGCMARSVNWVGERVASSTARPGRYPGRVGLPVAPGPSWGELGPGVASGRGVTSPSTSSTGAYESAGTRTRGSRPRAKSGGTPSQEIPALRAWAPSCGGGRRSGVFDVRVTGIDAEHPARISGVFDDACRRPDDAFRPWSNGHRC